MSTSPFRVAIIGGGMSGLALANGLQKHSKLEDGVEFKVFERYPADSNVPQGFQVSLGELGLSALEYCLPRKEWDEIQSMIHKNWKTGSLITVDSLDYKELLRFDGIPTIAIDRPRCREILLRGLRKDAIEWGRKFKFCEMVVSDGKWMVRSYFEDGSHYDADLLIGADGDHSAINRLVGLNNQYRMPVVGIKGGGPISQQLISRLPKTLREGGIFCWGPDATLGFFLVVEPNSPTDARAYWSMLHNQWTLPKELRWFDKDSRPGHHPAKELYRQFVLDILKDWGPGMEEFVKVGKEEDIVVHRMGACEPPKSNWRETLRREKGDANYVLEGNSQIWPIGDSLHKQTPALGAGANNALADSEVATRHIIELAHELRGKTVERSEIFESAVLRFEESIFPRAFWYVRKASSGKDKDLQGFSLASPKTRGLKSFLYWRLFKLIGFIMWLMSMLSKLWKAPSTFEKRFGPPTRDRIDK